MDRWLFLDSGPAPGAENMALDELLLERAERDRGAPVLRLYSFDPPAITIGAHQDPLEILDLEAVRSDGLDCVRRITGGRALLHEGELTYCVVAPAGAAGFGNGRAETFMRISSALRAALRSCFRGMLIGAPVRTNPSARIGRRCGQRGACSLLSCGLQEETAGHTPKSPPRPRRRPHSRCRAALPF